MRTRTTALVISFLCLSIAWLPLQSQTPTQKPSFEVASIKANKSGLGLANIDAPPNGRVNVVNVTFKMLMQWSYRLQDYQIIGGPDWLNTDRFDIQAKPSAQYQPKATALCLSPDCPISPVQIMMQNLLGDRFQLKTHRETRELAIYELRIGKDGFKLKEVDAQKPSVPSPPPPPDTAPPTNLAALPTPPPGAIMGLATGLAASAVPLDALASSLTDIVGRPVIDKTGMKGEYDIKLIYSREGLRNNVPPVGLDSSDPLPSIFTAMQEQLGLRLVPTKGPVEVLVIDRVQKPTAN